VSTPRPVWSTDHTRTDWSTEPEASFAPVQDQASECTFFLCVAYSFVFSPVKGEADEADAMRLLSWWWRRGALSRAQAILSLCCATLRASALGDDARLGST